MKTLESGRFLRDLAMELSSDLHFTHSDLRDAAVSNLLTAAISIIRFKDMPIAKSLKNVQDFLQACYGRHDELCAAVLEKVTNVQDLVARQIAVHVRGVLTPLVSYIADSAPSSSKPKVLLALGNLVTLTLDHSQNLNHPETRGYMQGLIQLACWEGGWNVVISRSEFCRFTTLKVILTRTMILVVSE